MVKPEYYEPIDTYIDKHQLEMSITRIQHRPGWMLGDMPGASHWLATIKQVGKGNPNLLTTFYSQGSAHKEAPQLRNLMDSLRSAAQCVTNARDFEEFASELGYDPDSRKTEATYNACKAVTRALERLLGREALRELLEEVEGL